MKRLPLGMQTFYQIIEDDYLYVDKTAPIHEMLTKAGKVVFLSRPRRFGKSLLCSTLSSLFEGRRELFEGLAIDELDWKWDEHPVIHIDFNTGNYADGKEALLENLNTQMINVSQRYGVELRGNISADKLTNLIIDLYNKYNQRAVVIIDEYDKPLLGTLDAPEIHKQLRGELKAFFGVLKSSDAYLQFSFITGVTRFSKVSIFSDLNQLDDISFDPRYATLCGITQEELERDFAEGIDEFAPVNELTVDEYKNKLKALYNGYRFTEKDIAVYNPFGLINHFMKNGKFAPYWFESGTPTWLYTLMQQQDFQIPDLENVQVFEAEFTNFDIEGMQLVPILYQSGYLTIKEYDKDYENFILGFPNEEVSSAFSTQLLKYLFPATAPAFYVRFPSFLTHGQPDDALELLKQFLAKIPYDVHEDSERYYHSMIDLIFRVFGLNIHSEVRTASGRIDTLVETKEHVYCFEFKLNSPTSDRQYTTQDALNQIDTKEYLTPWLGSNKQLHKVGVVFDYAKRNITEWECG